MTYLRESFCYQMWLTLLSVYDQSILHRCLVRLGAWCNAQVDESRILRVLCRQGAVARSWQESLGSDIPDQFTCLAAAQAVCGIPDDV